MLKLTIASALSLIAIIALSSNQSAFANERQRDLAYLAVADDGYWQLWISDANGKSAKQVTRSLTDKTRASWFPDGNSILLNDNSGTVTRVDIKTGVEKAVTLEQSPITDAVLSPDGSKIAFSFSTAIDGNDIWIADYPSGAATKVVRASGLQHEPTWSLDGTEVYFLSGDGGQVHDIWRVKLAALQTEQLTVGNLYHFDIAISPTNSVAFSSNRSGNYEIYLQELEKPALSLTDDPALDARPTFSPDGSEIIFESTRGNGLNLWKLNLSTRQVKRITKHASGARSPAWYRPATGGH